MKEPRYTKHNARRNLTLYWRRFYPDWTIPKGFHVHHIKPKCAFTDPNDSRIHHPRNLIALYVDDHVTIHKCRGDKITNGNFISCLKNYTHSQATRDKISASSKGHVPWNKGIPTKDSTKQLISKKLTGLTHTDITKEKIRKAHTGRTFTEESKRKMSKAAKGRVPWNKGKPHSAETKRRISEALKNRKSIL